MGYSERIARSSIIDASTVRATTASSIAYVLVLSLFFLWGVANNLNDILIKQFKNAFELSDFRAGLVQSAFYMGYFLLALPASMVTRRYGYKAALVVGLSLYALGALSFYPAASYRTYGLFLAALFVIASGLSFLETAANPLVTVLGPEEGAARRLNVAQSFNPLGSITGVLIGRFWIFSGTDNSTHRVNEMVAHAAQAQAVKGPYLVIAAVVILWTIMIAAAPLPKASRADFASADATAMPPSRPSTLWSKNLLLGVIAQFFYVGAQVGVWSFLIRYAQEVMPTMPERTAADGLTVSLVLFMCGRFTGSALLKKVNPRILLAGVSICAIASLTVAITLPGQIGLAALIVTSFFMSIMFPTIFALGLEGLDPQARKTGASFMVMAIVGGAVLPLLMGAVSDLSSMHRAMCVPLMCFAVVLVFAGTHGRRMFGG